MSDEDDEAAVERPWGVFPGEEPVAPLGPTGSFFDEIESPGPPVPSADEPPAPPAPVVPPAPAEPPAPPAPAASPEAVGGDPALTELEPPPRLTFPPPPAPPERVLPSGDDGADGDPFSGWPQPESQTLVEDAPSDGSVEHVSGEIDVPDGYIVLEGTPTGQRRSVAVIVSRFNGGLTNRMLASAIEALEDAGVAPESVTVVPVPGAFELPLTAMALAKTRRYACVVALGAIVRGETPHFDFVAAETASGIQLAGIETGVPVAFGVLTVETIDQAEARVDRAAEAVRTALEMADLFARLRASARVA
jgi:6,7-dimethyl-8-ribityllumazine synthase